MARQLDPTKIQRINEATIHLIVNKGYGNASIAQIARMAGVSDGYLYRFHKSKEDMVNSLIYEKINFLIEKIKNRLNEKVSISTLIRNIVEEIFLIAEKNVESLKFIYVLLHDYNFKIKYEQRLQIKNIIITILNRGQLSKEISPEITIEEAFYITIEYPLAFINMRLKNFFGIEKWTKKDQEKVIDFCIKRLK